MEDNKEQGDISEKIKIFSSDDEKLKVLGELLSNKSSRDIIRLLIEKEMYTNEIAKKLELRPNLVIHHLQKLEKLGLLEVSNKKIVRKGNDHKYYKIIPGVAIFPCETKETIEKKGILKFFRESINFIGIGIAASIGWLISQPSALEIRRRGEDPINPWYVVLVIIIAGLVIEIILLKKKKKS